ncbi:MAG: hypothetical protein CHACPFDD_01050 [Phycisphaerae bacterium]|nr:hypothetical protein [Phycisphaerae bacterium]
MGRSHALPLLILTSTLAILAGCAAGHHPSAGRAHGEQLLASSEPSLYARLGGYDAIAAVTDDFLDRLLKDPTQGRFFTGHSTQSKQRIRQHIVEQLCAAAGGPCVYTGRPTKEAHAGLGIGEQDWSTSVHHLVASLDKFKVPKREKDELLAILTSLKPDIVERP